jgi:hypothetical protein
LVDGDRLHKDQVVTPWFDNGNDYETGANAERWTFRLWQLVIVDFPQETKTAAFPEGKAAVFTWFQGLGEAVDDAAGEAVSGGA